MLELRIEATLGAVLAALGFLVAATGCCSHRHHGRRAIVALTAMFLSGLRTPLDFLNKNVMNSLFPITKLMKVQQTVE